MHPTTDRQSSYADIPVVIFCGGTGTRMREETEYRPKPMVEVGGRPILWHIMKIYAHQGFRRFILCLGYKAWSIKDYFLTHQFAAHDFMLRTGQHTASFLDKDAIRDDFDISFVDTGAETLTGERLLKVAHLLDNKPFMATYGDGVSDVDLSQLIVQHQKLRESHGAIGTITGVHPKSKYGLVMTHESGLIEKFTQYPLMPDYTNAGFMIFEPEFLSYCRPNTMVEDAMIHASEQGKLGMYRHEGFWHAMDTVKDKEDLEKMWKNEPRWKIWEGMAA